MRNFIKFFGIAAILAVIGFSITGCNDNSGSTNNNGNDIIGDGGDSVDNSYRGTYISESFSGTVSLITYEYTYNVSATKIEYIYKSNGVLSTNTIYDEAWTEGQELWVRGGSTRSLIGKFSTDGTTLTVGARIYVKSSVDTNYDINGAWYYSVQKYNFDNGNYELFNNDIPFKKGTYTIDDDSMTMEITHMGRYGLSSYSTYIDSSKEWYPRDELVNDYVNYCREEYRSSLQSTYDNYVKNYGVSTANQLFNMSYGTTDIDAAVEKQYGSTLSQLENTINTYANSLYTSSTVTYALRDTLFLGGLTFNK